MRGDYRTLSCNVSEQLKTRTERHGRPELFPVLAVSKIKAIIIIIFGVHSHVHGIALVECMHGVYVLIEHSSLDCMQH